MKKLWHDNAWEDYEWWYKNDKQIVKRIHKLIEDMNRHPFEGIGKPELLKHDFSGYWSRRITDEHRIVYTVKNDILVFVAMRYHY